MLLMSDRLCLWRRELALNELERQAWRLGLDLWLVWGEVMGVEKRGSPQGGAEHLGAAQSVLLGTHPCSSRSSFSLLCPSAALRGAATFTELKWRWVAGLAQGHTGLRD